MFSLHIYWLWRFIIQLHVFWDPKISLEVEMSSFIKNEKLIDFLRNLRSSRFLKEFLTLHLSLLPQIVPQIEKMYKLRIMVMRQQQLIVMMQQIDVQHMLIWGRTPLHYRWKKLKRLIMEYHSSTRCFSFKYVSIID